VSNDNPEIVTALFLLLSWFLSARPREWTMGIE